jgi:tetratricopeptide (TPR) repeat protein
VGLAVICTLAAAAASAQTPTPTPQPTPRRALPKLSNGARGFDAKKSADASSRLIAIGGGYGAGDEGTMPQLKRRTARGYYEWGLELMGVSVDKAINAFERAVRMNPNFVDAYWELGQVYAEYKGLVGSDGQKCDYRECYRRAIAAFEQVRRLQPGRAGVYNNLGVLYFNAGQYARALAAFQTGLRLKPKGGENEFTLIESGVLSDADVHFFIGDCYERLGRNELALASYERAVELSRLSRDEGFFAGDINERLGLIYEKLGETDKAIAAYLETIASPYHYRVDLPDVFQRLGLLYAAKGNYERAIEYLFKASEDYKKELLGLAEAEPAEEENIESRAEWESYLQSIKENLASIFYNLGVAYLSMTRTEKAATAFQQAIVWDARHSEARFNLGLAYLRLGDKAKAQEQAQLLKEIDAELAKELEELVKR